MKATFLHVGYLLFLIMRIGFDAKRAFFNKSGLGNYSRSTISILAKFYNENSYFLYTPPGKSVIDFDIKKYATIRKPEKYIGKKFPSFWRSFQLPDQLKQDKIDLFHGLSNEIPFNFKRSGIKSVVTIHDLIFLRYPEWYPLIDRKIYEVKFRRSCRDADRIIAISKQTKNDIIEFFGTDKNKIDVVYQGCNNLFKKKARAETVNKIRSKYSLPSEYLLYVGTVEKRKNLLTIIKALKRLGIKVPLLVVGKQTSYSTLVLKYIKENKLKNIRFLEYVDNTELPAIYQNAKIFIYPSLFEGFGIPVLEALFSKIPVITSARGCFSESGGPATIYIDPENDEEMADKIMNLLEDDTLREKVINKGYAYAQNFTDEKIAKNLIKVYNKIL